VLFPYGGVGKAAESAEETREFNNTGKTPDVNQLMEDIRDPQAAIRRERCGPNGNQPDDPRCKLSEAPEGSSAE
jgi:hypothetical protein